jgi:FkbM family methyltransferase
MWAFKLTRLKAQQLLSELVKRHTYTVRSGIAAGTKRKGGLGFIPLVPLTEEEKFLSNLDFSGQTVYDIGASIGNFTAFFCRAVGRLGKVVVFEPNPELYNMIIENVKLNCFNHVNIRRIALAAKSGKTILVFFPYMLGSGSILNEFKNRFLQKKEAKSCEVEVDTLDNQIRSHRLPKPDFVKIDVNGVELEVLKGMQRTIEACKPRILIEVYGENHPDWRNKNLREMLEFLTIHGYSVCHLESKGIIGPSDTDTVKTYDHLYCF